MKTIHISILASLAVILLFTAALANRRMASKSSIEKTINGDGFAVLELFTSEGCSSCPPADELLAKVQRESGDKPVYVLAYHVDYWNHQGWRDVFSDPEYSKRQYQYAHKLHAQVYTPQVVVNGKTEFVGSNEAAVNYALGSALGGTSLNSIKLQGQRQGDKMLVNYQVSGAEDSDELVIAVVQKNAVSEVKRGENEGRTLRHVQIVRRLFSFDRGKGDNGRVQILLPKEFTSAGWEVIGLLQNKNSRKIQAANRLSIL